MGPKVTVHMDLHDPLSYLFDPVLRYPRGSEEVFEVLLPYMVLGSEGPFFHSLRETGPGEKLGLSKPLLVHVGAVFPKNRDHDMGVDKDEGISCVEDDGFDGHGFWGMLQFRKTRVL
jgi:hypothetical protein